MKLSNHLADIHQLSAVERKYYLSGAKYLSDPGKPGDMSRQKRMRNHSEDDMSTVARDEKSEEEMSSPKRIRNESDNQTSTVSNKDIFSSSDDDKSSEETDDASNEGESSEETNDSDEEADPWGALIDEATAELHTKHSELVQSFENGFSEIDAKKQAFAAILPELRKELGNVYMDRLQWMSQLKRDPVHRKIMKIRDAFVAEDEFDPDEALVAAVKKRKFILERMLEDRQHFPEKDDDDDDNACVPYGLRNELHYHYR